MVQGCWATTPQAKVYSRHTHLKAGRASRGQDRRGTGDTQETHGERRCRLETDQVGGRVTPMRGNSLAYSASSGDHTHAYTSRPNTTTQVIKRGGRGKTQPVSTGQRRRWGMGGGKKNTKNNHEHCSCTMGASMHHGIERMHVHASEGIERVDIS